MKNNNAVKIAVSLPRKLYGRAETLRKSRGLTRSGFYGEALRAYFGLLEVREMESRYAEGYRKTPEDLGEIAAALKTSVRASPGEEW